MPIIVDSTLSTGDILTCQIQKKFNGDEIAFITSAPSIRKDKKHNTHTAAARIETATA